jgi:hypothetical protein
MVMVEPDVGPWEGERVETLPEGVKERRSAREPSTPLFDTCALRLTVYGESVW